MRVQITITTGSSKPPGPDPNQLPFNVALEWYLIQHHWPPISESFVLTCRNAIVLAARGEYDSTLRIPPDVLPGRGKRWLTVLEIVQFAKLQKFVLAYAANMTDDELFG